MGGIFRGLQAAATTIKAQSTARAAVVMAEFGMAISKHNGTQKRRRRDPCGCDASHDLKMFRRKSYKQGAIRGRDRPPGSFDPVERHVYRSTMSAQKAAKDAPPDFELAMRDLEELVERLERGDLPLEESLAAFERGVMLTRACQTALKEAEQKVEILLKKAGEPAVEAFAAEDGKNG